MTRALPCLLVLASAACEQPTRSLDLKGDGAARAPVASTEPLPADRIGLAAIKARGKLRLLTRNNGTCYFVAHGKPMGFDYELAELFAAEHGVGVEVIVPENWGDLVPQLLSGAGDIIAANMTVTPERQELVRFAAPYALTHIRVVWRRGTAKLEAPEDLSGRTVHVRRNSNYYGRLEELNRLFLAAQRPPVDVVIEGESLETEQILEEVAAGRIPYTLCDYNICMENQAYLPELVVGPRVSDPQALAWAVHPQAADLAEAVDRFFARIKASGGLDALTRRYYETPRTLRGRPEEKLSAKHRGQISPFDDWFKAGQRQYGIDWRLLAALAYQESRFDAKAGTWRQGKGLFGMLPSFAAELGFRDLADANPATAAAATYLVRLQSQFAGVMREDDRLRLTIAAFHSGAGHVTDARLLATEQKLDPDRWENVAQALRQLSHAARAARAQHGYVRGSEVVAYVDEVWERFRAYRHATGDRDATP